MRQGYVVHIATTVTTWAYGVSRAAAEADAMRRLAGETFADEFLTSGRGRVVASALLSPPEVETVKVRRLVDTR